jgi:hypothetical protein
VTAAPTPAELARSLTVRSGRVEAGALTLFSVMRDERHLVEAWLDHHRGLGFRQFLVLDDGSEDGTAELLAAQPDVVMLGSPHRFGDPGLARGRFGILRRNRAGTAMKDAAPRRFLPQGAWSGYLDADEFLILPPGIGSVGEVVGRTRWPGIAASVVDFFPERLTDRAAPPPPPARRLDDLLAEAPFFEAEPVMRLRGPLQPVPVAPAKSTRLFEAHLGGGPDSARVKVPLARLGPLVHRFGSHKLNLPPDPRRLLAVAHMIFTADFAAKVARARAWGSHVGGGEKYHRYAQLIDALDAAGATLTGPASRRFDAGGARAMLECGLIRWP